MRTGLVVGVIAAGAVAAIVLATRPAVYDRLSGTITWPP
jgi:hypothetical protein